MWALLAPMGVAMASNLEANIWGVLGASGTGKGAWIKGRLKHDMKPARMVIWDFMDEYGDFARQVTTLEGIRKAMVRAGADGNLCVRYVPRGAGEKAVRQEFETLCELVYAWGGCVFIAEELANVTTPGWAPAAWRKMTTSGRHCGVHIIGTSQTPALVDKTFLGNCTKIHVSALRTFDHRVAVSRSMDVDEGRIALLVKLQWIEKDFDTGEVTVGFIDPATGKLCDRAPTPRGPSPTGRGAAKPGQQPAPKVKVKAQNGAGGRS